LLGAPDELGEGLEFPIFPAAWSEKKPAANWQPAKPAKRKRRK
jgi:hypothetical protein